MRARAAESVRLSEEHLWALPAGSWLATMPPAQTDPPAWFGRNRRAREVEAAWGRVQQRPVAGFMARNVADRGGW
jgi:hypothetical protein